MGGKGGSGGDGGGGIGGGGRGGGGDGEYSGHSSTASVSCRQLLPSRQHAANIHPVGLLDDAVTWKKFSHLPMPHASRIFQHVISSPWSLNRPYKLVRESTSSPHSGATGGGGGGAGGNGGGDGPNATINDRYPSDMSTKTPASVGSCSSASEMVCPHPLHSAPFHPSPNES